MDKKVIILLTHDLYDSFIERFRFYGENGWHWIRVDFGNPHSEYQDDLAKAVCIISRRDLSSDEYAIAKKLRLLQIPIAGYENIDLKRAEKHGIYVCNNGGANAPSVAEHVILLLLSLQRNFHFHTQAIKSQQWKNKKYSNLEMFQKKLGIIGLGHCGKALAYRAKAFNMTVQYFDIRRDIDWEQNLGIKYAPFEFVLKESDIISLHVPLTNKTRKMINQQSLSLLKPNSVLVNTSRGEVIDEDALIKVLQAQKIKGACLDVFEHEPLPKNSPLLSADNIILTPHCGASYESMERTCANIASNIYKVCNNKIPDFLVIDYEN